LNISPLQFLHQDVPALVETVLAETGLDPMRLEIEVTEGSLTRDRQKTFEALERIRKLGVRIAMDDFGISYAALSTMASFPFDKIKIDRRFPGNMDESPAAVAIVRAIIGLGHGLGLPITAEGVETQGHVDFLHSEQCTEMQGFLIGAPQPSAAYSHLVSRVGARTLVDA
jgi:EAL domain-containing protein (putative c-di-GMP-specific phosphodiesterase class I)